VRSRVDRWSAGTVLLVSSLAVLLAVSVVIGLLLDMIDEQRGLSEADAWVARWGADHATDASTRVVEAVTQLGARPVVLLALALAAFADWYRRRNREVFFFVAAVGLGEMLIVNALKLLVERERPAVMRLVDAGGWSFPSGHTSAAAAGWMAVALVLGRGRSRRTKALLSGGAVLVAAAVATSRALLGVHWLTDVLAGLAVGWGWYLVVAIAFGGRRQRLGAPLQQAAPDVVAPHPGDAEPEAPSLTHGAASRSTR
jgi:undecaprenyl-diphosphatase